MSFASFAFCRNCKEKQGFRNLGRNLGLKGLRNLQRRRRASAAVICCARQCLGVGHVGQVAWGRSHWMRHVLSPLRHRKLWHPRFVHQLAHRRNAQFDRRAPLLGNRISSDSMGRQSFRAGCRYMTIQCIFALLPLEKQPSQRVCNSLQQPSKSDLLFRVRSLLQVARFALRWTGSSR